MLRTTTHWFVKQDLAVVGPLRAAEILALVANNSLDCTAEIACRQLSLEPTPIREGLRHVTRAYLDERADARASLFGEVAAVDGRRAIGGEAQNISPTGLFFVTGLQPFSVGAVLTITLRSPDLPRQLRLKAIVRRQTAITPTAFGCAVEFLGTSQDDKNLIIRYVDETLFAPLHMALRLGAAQEVLS